MLFSGDLVEYGATPYTGDAYLTDWPATLDALAALQPRKARARTRRGADGRRQRSKEGLDGTRAFVTAMFAAGQARRRAPARTCARSTGHVRRAQAEVRPLGDLRPLPAVRRDARVRRGDALSAIRASGRRSATRRCGRRSKARARRRHRRRRAMATHVQLVFAVPRACASLDGGGRARRRSRRRRRPGRARRWRSTSRSTASPVLVLDDDDTCRASARARSATRSARSRSRPARLRATRARQGRAWNVGKVFFRDAPRLRVRPARRSRVTAVRRSSTCSSTMSRVPRRPRARSSASSCAGATRWSAVEPSRRRRRASTVATPDGSYATRLRLAGRVRRRAQPGARDAGTRQRGQTCSATAS